ncbi:MAG: fibronectin type III domain-containing protein [Candidatus Aminicenantes bacterium]|nr:fibronectin type III domain-containing protein [Candidatus Aminicenantes bacterium]
MKKLLIIIGVFLILVMNLAAQSKIYWVDYATGKVQRSNTDGSSVQDLVTGLTDANGIAVDSINGKIYWGRGTSPGKIQRANLDGSSATDLITGMANVVDIALDVNNGKIYWTNNFDQKIQRANLDGSNVQDLLTGRQDPAGISVDTINGKIYWVERVGLKICRANLDGSSVQDLITSTAGLSSPYGLELDLTNSRMYFSDFGTGKIQRANLDGTGITDVLTGLGWDVDAVAVDPRNSVIYYATYNTSIGKVNYNGTGNASVVTGLGTTSGIHFYDPSYTISGNAGAVGATLSYTDGIAKTATSDGSGNYTFQVSYSWSGTVTPSLTGYTFSPVNRTYTNVLANQTSQNYTATAITYAISGNAGIAGATLSYTDGSPKTAAADGSGNYSFTVSYNWSGTVTPSYTGYSFTPANRTYTNVLSNQTSQDYTAAAITYTISGNAGAAGATLSYTDGSAKTANADGSGNYTFTVSYNWSGTVTPSLTGYTFTPANRTYTNVLANQTSQNYTATAVTYTISGNAGVAGATLSYTDGTPKTAAADGSGNYSFTVSYNWSGTVTPSLTGYTFTPANRTYTNVLSNQASQDYTATIITYTISGNAGIAGATLSYTDGTPKTAAADGSGDYSFTVSYNWSGTVTPSYTGYSFTPANRTYTNVLSNQTSQDYTAAPIIYTISGSAGAAGVTLSYTDGTPKTAAADGSGNYSFTVSYNWSGTVTPSLTGYSFTPASRTYTNVLANQTSQDYTATGITYTISGNAGIGGATLSYTDGTPQTATADGSGNYSFTVSYNWSGTVTPSLTGYTFTPANRTYTNVLSNQASQDYTANIITYTISGNAGIAAATLSYTDGTPKTATADGSGNYSFTVSYNWSGTVTPSYTGYSFTPANRTYTNVLANQTSQDYTATAITYTISGSAGVAGATLSYTDGTPKTAAADGSGNYSFTVSYNWSGTVTPSLTGYSFTPASRTYTNVLSNQTSQDYTAAAITYTISGNAGIAAATLSYTDGTPQTAAADGSGNYSFTVSYNWSGTVTPSLTGYTFTPTDRTYTNVLSNQTSQDYTANIITYTISGNAGVAGATLSYTDGTPKTASADGSGNYSFTVSYNWSGTVTPSLTGYIFTPTDRTYTNVLSNQTGQDYSAVFNAPVATAAANILGTSFSANWNAAAGAAGYRLDVATDAGFTSFVTGCNNLDVGNVTTYSVSSNINPGTTYYYRLRAYNGSVTSGNSNTITVLTGPDAPVATAASAITQTSFSANWNAVTGAAGYYLDVAADSGFTTYVTGWQNVDVGNVTTYSVNSNINPGITYYYRVRAYNASGTSDNSNTITVLTTPGAPTATAAANVQSTGFSANWNAVTGAAGYYLDVATDVDFADLVSGYNNRNVGNVTTFTVNTNLSPGTRYYYRVRAYNGSGTSGNSNVISLQTGPAAPTATAAAAITQTSFSANWNLVSGVSGYRIDVATDSGFTSFVAGYNNLDVGNVTTYSVNSNINPGITYYYRLRSYNASGTSSNSNTISLVTIPGEPVATAAANIQSNSFSANWNAVAGASGYYLDVATDAGFTTFVTGYNNLNVGNVTTYSVNANLTPLTPYYYRVRAYNINGTSGNSNVITLTTIAALPTVTTTAVNHITYSSANSGGNVTDNGGAPVTARGVCWSTSPNPTFADYVTVNGSGDGAFTSKLTGLHEYTTYYVRAYAANSTGTGYGQELHFTTNAESISVTITEPQDNAEVSGTVIIKASTSANLKINADSAHRAVSRVEFYIDDVKIAEDTSAPYETSWDSAAVSDGSHKIKAIAYNLADQASQDEITVQVKNTPPQPPHISLNRTQLNFGAIQGDVQTSSQSILVDNMGAGTLNWTAAGDAALLSVTPGSGGNAGMVTVSVNAAGLSIGTYEAVVTFEDANADNSPQTVAIKLTVYGAGFSNPPFGSFDTPEDGSTVMSSVPVTGWALDDIEAVGVKIYRGPITGEGDGLVYIGDAIFVDGARPDVELAYPDYPFNYRAGWGYMLLTNFLPNGGNGTFTLHALVTDKEGHEVTLGTKTITCDNAHALKPFGAIDTPAQGGEAAGKSFVNYGWTLTPQPNTVPKDGSTIGVWVDGVQLGNPVYNLYREDIASLFPGYNNSDGAVGYYYLDTTLYANGVHTMAWTVTDNAGNSDGVGSRYFAIVNITSPDGMLSTAGFDGYSDIRQAPISDSPVYVRTGFSANTPTAAFYPDQDGVITIKVRECERVEIRLNDNPAVHAAGSGRLEVGDRLRPLPVGSTLNRGAAIFVWQPGPGFLGEFRLVFGLKSDDGQVARKIVKVQIVSGY